MATTWNRTEELDLDLTLNIILAQVCSADLDLVPAEGTAFWPFDFRLVDWSVLAECDVAVQDEEAKLIVLQVAHRTEPDHLLVSCRLLLLG